MKKNLSALNELLGVEKDDLILFVADKKKVVADVLGEFTLENCERHEI